MSDNRRDFSAKADAPEEQTQVPVTKIEGRNPVLEALCSGRTIDKLYVLDGCRDSAVQTILRKARRQDTIVSFVSRERLDQISETHHHEGVIAMAAAYAYAEVEDILQKAKDAGEDPFIILLDGIEDPHNLGAVLRTADAVGATGVVFKKTHAVGLTPTVGKVSAGAIDTVKCAPVTNLVRAVETLQKNGWWVVGTDMDGQDYRTLDYQMNTVLVIGNEGKGISRLLRDKCDFVISLPMRGKIESLNASVSAGILMYQIYSTRFPAK